MPFDAENGQVFTETVVSVHRRTRAIKAVHGSLGQKPAYRPPPLGAHSLRDIATRHLLCNLEALGADALEATPSFLVEDLWKAITRAHLDSLAVWRLFACVGHFNRANVKQLLYSHHNADPSELHCMFTAVVNAQFSWLVDLTLGHFEREMDALMLVPDICNLRSLHLRVSGAKYSLHRLFKAWSHSAREKQAFRKLEMIFVDGSTFDSAWSLQYLHDFPLLSTFVIHDSKCGKSLLGHGGLKNSHLHGWLANPDAIFVQNIRKRNLVDGVRHTCGWQDLVDDFILQQRCQAPKDDSSPVLDVRFGRRDHVKLCTANDVLCLERDWSFQAPQCEERAVRYSPMKKRKLKNWKTQSLRNLIDGF